MLKFPLVVAVIYLVPGLFYLTPVSRFCEKYSRSKRTWFAATLLAPVVALPALYGSIQTDAVKKRAVMLRLIIMVLGVQSLFFLAGWIFGGYNEGRLL